MPYRVDLRSNNPETLERLIELGALDAEQCEDGTVVAVMPDRVAPQQVARTADVRKMRITPDIGRDDGSTWIVSPRPIQVGRIRIVPSHFETARNSLRMIDAGAFGTGLHPTTALCLEALEEAVQSAVPEAVLDVGTGSGVLALAALLQGVPRAVGIDTDDDALRVADENARLNGFHDRLDLVRGGPETVTGVWPLVLANVLAAPLIEMAPALVRRVGHYGLLVLSGIPGSVEQDVRDAYRRLGMRDVRTTSRGGWVVLIMQGLW